MKGKGDKRVEWRFFYDERTENRKIILNLCHLPRWFFGRDLFGGVFWGLIGIYAYYFNFTEIRPNVILEPWALGDWKKGWLRNVISIFLMGGFFYWCSFHLLCGVKKIQRVLVWTGIWCRFILIGVLCFKSIISEYETIF